MHIQISSQWADLVGATTIELKTIDQGLSFITPGISFSPRWRAMEKIRRELKKRGKPTDHLWDGKYHFLSKHLRIPSGLAYKASKLVGCDVIDTRFDRHSTAMRKGFEMCMSNMLNGITLSDFQLDSIRKGVEFGHGNFFLATNAGKSAVITGISKAIGLKSLWLVRRKDLLHQCAEFWKAKTGIEPGVIGDGLWEERPGMNIGSVQTLSLKRPGVKQLLNRIEMLFVDEAPHASSNTWYSLCMACPAPFRYALTGTAPDETLKLYRMMAATSGQVLARMKNADLIEMGWSATPTFHIQQVSHADNKWSYQKAYDTTIRFNKRFAAVIADEVRCWYDKGDVILIIVDRIAQGINVCGELSGRKIPNKFLSGDVGGYMRKKILDGMRAGKERVVVATSVLDEGVDVPSINTLILGAGGMAVGRQLQRVGRALRRKTGDNKVNIIDYAFLNNRYLLEHSIVRVNTYTSQGFDVQIRDGEISI